MSGDVQPRKRRDRKRHGGGAKIRSEQLIQSQGSSWDEEEDEESDAKKITVSPHKKHEHESDEEFCDVEKIGHQLASGTGDVASPGKGMGTAQIAFILVLVALAGFVGVTWYQYNDITTSENAPTHETIHEQPSRLAAIFDGLGLVEDEKGNPSKLTESSTEKDAASGETVLAGHSWFTSTDGEDGEDHVSTFGSSLLEEEEVQHTFPEEPGEGSSTEETLDLGQSAYTWLFGDKEEGGDQDFSSSQNQPSADLRMTLEASEDASAKGVTMELDASIEAVQTLSYFSTDFYSPESTGGQMDGTVSVNVDSNEVVSSEESVWLSGSKPDSSLGMDDGKRGDEESVPTSQNQAAPQTDITTPDREATDISLEYASPQRLDNDNEELKDKSVDDANLEEEEGDQNLNVFDENVDGSPEKEEPLEGSNDSVEKDEGNDLQEQDDVYVPDPTDDVEEEGSVAEEEGEEERSNPPQEYVLSRDTFSLEDEGEHEEGEDNFESWLMKHGEATPSEEHLMEEPAVAA